MLNLLNSFFTALSPLELVATLALVGTLVARISDSDDSNDDENEDENEEDSNDEDDVEADLSFNFTADELREYEEMVHELDARVDELTDALESGNGSPDALRSELMQARLARAARLQEEGEYEKAVQDYEAAFALFAAEPEAREDSIDALKQLAAGRLNYGILLNDAGELDASREQYERAQAVNEKLAALGDAEAKLDLIGVRLNLAGLAFERGERAESINALDDASEEFQKIAEEDAERRPDALYYLAKTLVTKADFIRATIEDETEESPEKNEAHETLGRAVEIYRSLVTAGRTDSKRDLADALVSLVATSTLRSERELDEAIDSLTEAREHYASVVACGEPDASVELFDASMQQGELLLKREREQDVITLYNEIVYAFEQFEESGELPLYEGLAVARQRLAQLQKGKISTKAFLDHLNKAIELQIKIANDLIASLGSSDEDGCGCDCDECEHEHEHSCGCGCEHEREHEHEHEHSCGCGCGCEHEREHEHSCGCGCCGGEAKRDFLVSHWVGDNFGALMECLYERVAARLELNDRKSAFNDCLLAEKIVKEYRKVLRPEEALESEFADKLRDLKFSLM